MTWQSDIIIEGGSGNPHEQASRARERDMRSRSSAAARHPAQSHGLSVEQQAELNRRFSQMLPQLATSNPTAQRLELFKDDLPKGANWDARRTASSSFFGGNSTALSGLNSNMGGGGSMTSIQRPYQPEFESPDRQQYPVHRILANRYWRLFIKLDPVVGTGLDMYGEMPWGDCQLTGEGVDGEVRQVYEQMWETCAVPAVLPVMVREFLGLGEVIPHCFYDDAVGMWTYIALHNPDNLEIVDAPFIKMDPIVEFVPDDKLRQILTSTDPELQQVRDSLPEELLGKLYSRQNIRINTDVNATFIARKLHPYETRGTSILSRMWRIFMYEDAIFNASIATARRHAGPLKVAKLGNPQTNWIPGPEHERRFAELVAQAEIDPHAWIIYHYGLSLEAFGTTDRVMTINREWDVIERIKLAALGISRSFLTGELTFASATAGLQVFLRRLLAVRSFFDSVWIRPKFFRPIAAIRNFVKPTQSELAHGIRVRRTAQQLAEDNRLIVPTIEWTNKLNPTVDKDLLDAYKTLEKDLGLRISKTKKMAAAGLKFEDELRKGIEEDKLENKIRKEYGVPDEKGDPAELKKIEDNTDETKKDQQPGGGASGAPKGPEEGKEGDADKPTGPRPVGMPPPNPRGPVQSKGAPAPASPAKEPVEAQPEPEEDDGDSDSLSRVPWDSSGKAFGWDEGEVAGLIDLLRTGTTDQAFWAQLLPQEKKVQRPAGDGTYHSTVEMLGENPADFIARGDTEGAWQLIEDFLQEEGFPDADIAGLKRILAMEGVMRDPGRIAALERFEASLPDDPASLDDAAFDRLFADTIAGATQRRPVRLASGKIRK